MDCLILTRAGAHVQGSAVGADRLDCRARGCDRGVLGEGGRDSEANAAASEIPNDVIASLPKQRKEWAGRAASHKP